MIVSDPLVLPLESYDQLKQSSENVCMNSQWYSKQLNTYQPITTERDQSIVVIVT